MRVLRWLADYWYIPVLAIVAVLGVLWFRTKDPMKWIERELRAIDSARETRAIQIELGAEQATQHVKDKYKAKRETLDAKDEAKVAKLENDPVALAKFLEKVTR